MESETKINLYLINGSAYVWTIEDWLKLRNLRIVGNFIGSLAALPRQDQTSGLPLALLNEETTLLLEKGYAVLKNLPEISGPPNEGIRDKYAEARQKILSEQAEILLEKRKKEIESKIDLIIKGKQAKRSDCQLDKETVLQEEFDKLQPSKPSSLVVQIPTADPWIEDEETTEATWNFPSSEEERVRYAVFKDLWEQGYFITPGGKFGGDFLAYPGDPVKFHAHFIVVCVDKKQKIRMSEFITYGRLGQSVKKTAVLAYLDGDRVNYQSIQWAGF